MRNLFHATFAFLAGAVAVGALATSADARDAYPCGRPVGHDYNGATITVQYCPLTQGHVPVYADPTTPSPIVGWLNAGGSANWFTFQSCHAYWYNPVLHRTDQPFRLGSYVNGWYASTLSDPPSRWGYVPEVYFRGGDNWEHDAGLHIAGPGVGATSYCK
jgi:hypothetical protein